MKKMPGQLAAGRWLLAAFALAYGIIMVRLEGTPLTELYSISPYHRDQAAALLEGHFYLADSIDAVEPALAWHAGKVQQVWGLGVALWLLPFQALWRLAESGEFPDRVGLVFAFGLFAFYTGSTGIRLAREGLPIVGLGLVWLLLLSPPLWNLARASHLVFEQTVLFAVVLSLGMLVGLVRFSYLGINIRLLDLLCASRPVGLARPTAAIYGLIAVSVCVVLFWVRHRALASVIAGSLVFVGGLGVEGLSNWVRFGSPLEFGHRLTVSTDSMVFLTRFGNPFAGVGTLDAARELGGLLFSGSNRLGGNAFSEGRFAWQAPAVRWRRPDLSTFDWSYATLCVAGVSLSAPSGLRRFKEQ